MAPALNNSTLDPAKKMQVLSVNYGAACGMHGRCLKNNAIHFDGAHVAQRNNSGDP